MLGLLKGHKLANEAEILCSWKRPGKDKIRTVDSTQPHHIELCRSW